LSRAEGRLRVDWRVKNGRLDMNWIESCGPPVKQPLAVGFGSRLIELSVGELGGNLKRDYAASGLICRINFSVGERGYQGLEVEYEAGSMASDNVQKQTSLDGKAVLLVEDQALVSDDLADLLNNVGMSTIGPAISVSSALALLENSRPDAAILDVNLNGELAFPIADALLARGIPFFFITGYGDPYVWPEHLRQCRRLIKPVHGDSVLTALSAVLGASVASHGS
jgi:CheY-like chemotaxis protein